MKTRSYAWLFVGGILAAGLMAAVTIAPGYLDADYYYASGMQLAKGEGFSAPFVWNYLDDPQALPHPTHTYWMPLPAMLASIPMALAGNFDFLTARLPFLLLMALLPPLTAHLAWRLSGDEKTAVLSGIFAILSGFYMPFLAVTDSFGGCMALGILMFLLIERVSESPGRGWQALLLGIVLGLISLCRADGFIWFLVVCTGLIVRGIRKGGGMATWPMVMAGYLATLTPWLAHTYQATGSLFSLAGSRTLWLVDYNEIFLYPASQLNADHLVQSGLSAILNSRLWAAGQNAQTILVVEGLIILTPFMIAGFWGLKDRPSVRMGGWGWLITVAVMTVVFPFSGARGGLFHSGSLVQPLLWALAASGFSAAVKKFSKWRLFDDRRTYAMYGAGVVLALALISGFVVSRRVVGEDISRPAWNKDYYTYRDAAAYLDAIPDGGEATVMVNNPPGFYAIAQRPAIMIPAGGVDTVMEVGRQFEAEYLLLDRNHVEALDPLFQSTGAVEGIAFLAEVDGVRIYRMAHE